MNDNRIIHHQVLSEPPKTKWVKITVDGKKIEVREGETIAAALITASIKVFRYTLKRNEFKSPLCSIYFYGCYCNRASSYWWYLTGSFGGSRSRSTFQKDKCCRGYFFKEKLSWQIWFDYWVGNERWEKF